MLVLVVAWMAVFDRLLAPLFSWMPATLLQFATVETGGEPLVGGALAVMVAAVLVFNGIVGPVVEELYFRGHLLPRIDRLGRRAPVLHTALFMAYHLWTPWRWPQILLGYLPTSWLVWRKRSISLSLATHMTINMVFSLLLIAVYLQAAAV
jgi:uncharacterized protein